MNVSAAFTQFTIDKYSNDFEFKLNVSGWKVKLLHIFRQIKEIDE